MEYKDHVQRFEKLLENNVISEFLKRDTCGALCDKYHLSTIIEFFARAQFNEQDYTVRNFFLALVLSHDLYDESKLLKDVILAYYLSRKDKYNSQSTSAFHRDKLLLFQRMGFKGFIEGWVCEKWCWSFGHRNFYRCRRELHGGVLGNSVLCRRCKFPTNETLRYHKISKCLDMGSKAKKARKNYPNSSLFFLGDE